MYLIKIIKPDNLGENMKKLVLLMSCFLFYSTAFGAMIDGWDIKINNVQALEKFFISKDVETYTGDMIVSELEEKPNEGFVFVRVDLTVQKEEKDNNTFNSAELILQVNNQTYSRLNDDSFLGHYNIKPFTRLKIKKGKHSGSIVFEIPENMKNETKTVLYKQRVVD